MIRFHLDGDVQDGIQKFSDAFGEGERE